MSVSLIKKSEGKVEARDPLDSLKQELELLDQLRSLGGHERRIPSSIMLQVLMYGDTFKRVVTTVSVDYGRFEEEYRRFASEMMKARCAIPTASRSFYNRYWVEPKTMDEQKAREYISYVVEPLKSLPDVNFGLSGPVRFNWKFSEVVETYVFQERIEGVCFFNDGNSSLTVFSKIRGSQQRMTVPDVFVDYYVLLRLEPAPGGGLSVVYSCTCPHARGETRDSRGRNIPPEVVGMCKHVIASLFYFFPNVFAYLLAYREGGVSRGNYERMLRVTTEAYDAFKARLDEVSKELGGIPKNAQPSEETPLRVVYSNASYLIFREFWSLLTTGVNGDPPLSQAVKIAPTVSHLHLYEQLWRSLSITVSETVEDYSGQQPSRTADLRSAIGSVEQTGLFRRLDTLRSILNGLQGAVEDTPYTKALLAALVLGSNLYTDPTIVSSYGDPGTGKTLTASMLGELVGIRSVVVEKEVTHEDLLLASRRDISRRVEKLMGFFERLVLRRVPPERAEEARKLFADAASELSELAVSGDVRELASAAKRFADMFSELCGVDSKKLRLSVAKLLLSFMKLAKKAYAEQSSKEALESRVVEERRNMLRRLQELGLISSAEEKERFNSGAVRWEVLQTASGYRIMVYVDLHYLFSKFMGDRGKIAGVLDELSKIGRLRVETQKGGVAEIKLSEASYLEKALKTREEDITGRLIWVGGEVTRMGAVLIDESRRAPEFLERLLTDLSKAAKDTKRTNVIITTDNAEPLMEAESDPRLDAFHSRVNFEVATPSSTVEVTIEETLRTINRMDLSGELPLVTLDELYVLNKLSEHVYVPERYVLISYSIPLLMVYDFKVLRPEIVASIKSDQDSAPPLLLLVPKGGFDAGNVKGDYEACSLGDGVPGTRRMPERRFGHHMLRAMRVLAVVDRKTEVDKDVLLSALSLVLPSRVVPVDVANPYVYFDYKQRVVSALVSKVDEAISKEQTSTEKLVEVLGSMSAVPPKLLQDSLEEMIENPVLAAVFCRFLEQMLVSKKAREFIRYSKTVPGLYRTLEMIARYEKLPVVHLFDLDKS